jgi:PHD/YefM family antitoxin component YafN of YafNO toxin-antitoxin module
MADLKQIHPVEEFVREYELLLARIKETGNPEVLTVDGSAEYVILDAASYESIADELENRRFVSAVNEGIDDMNLGRGKPLNEAISAIRTVLARPCSWYAD